MRDVDHGPEQIQAQLEAYRRISQTPFGDNLVTAFEVSVDSLHLGKVELSDEQARLVGKPSFGMYLESRFAGEAKQTEAALALQQDASGVSLRIYDVAPEDLLSNEDAQRQHEVAKIEVKTPRTFQDKSAFTPAIEVTIPRPLVLSTLLGNFTAGVIDNVRILNKEVTRHPVRR